MEHYVERTLHTAVERGPLDGAGRLPLYLRGSYGFGGGGGRSYALVRLT